MTIFPEARLKCQIAPIISERERVKLSDQQGRRSGEVRSASLTKPVIIIEAQLNAPNMGCRHRQNDIALGNVNYRWSRFPG